MPYDQKQKLIFLLKITQQESLVIKLVNDFLENNPKIGYVVFQVFHVSPTEGLLPIPNAMVTVSKHMGEGNFISRVLTTNTEGKTDPIPLPAVEAEPSLPPGNQKAYTTYNTRIEAHSFLTKDIFDFKIFDNSTSVETVVLSPGISDEVHKIYIGEPQPLSVNSQKLWLKKSWAITFQ